jgi:hypothetical protein
MVEPTRPIPHPQEEGKDNFVGRLRNTVQKVDNAFEEQMAAITCELNMLQMIRTRLLEEKSNPLMSQAKIQKKIADNQAEITPLSAEVEILKEVRQKFEFKTDINAEKAVHRFKTRDREPKQAKFRISQTDYELLIAKVNKVEAEKDELKRALTASDARAK